MKILKYILIAVAVLVIGFFLLGMVKSEVTYENEIMVDKSLDESWAVAQDDEKLGEWLEGYQKMEHVSGTPGTVGAEMDVYFDNKGETMVIRETITDIKPKESISMTFSMDFMNMDYTMNMEEIDSKTKINSTTTASGNGAFAKSMMAIMGGSMSTQEDNNLANLKKAIEENNKSYLQPAEVMEAVEIDSVSGEEQSEVE